MNYHENYKLIDKHGRKITKLRLSLLDVCNMQCFYCMPKKVNFTKNKNWLSSEEIFSITKSLNQFGINEIRLTGGEPTLRDDLVEIATKLSKLNLQKLAMTTNGLKLNHFLNELKNTSLNSFNVSLDSLDKKTFHRITNHDSFHTVFTNILKAKELGYHVKVNTVLLKGINDHEIKNFISFSREFNIPVRFLEVMQIGAMVPLYKKHFMSWKECLHIFKDEFSPIEINSSIDSTSKNFQLNNGATIGFIASETNSFCQNCSRLRMGPDGKIYPCLFIDQGESIRNINKEDYPKFLSNILDKKPIERITKIEKPMYQIGG